MSFCDGSISVGEIANLIREGFNDTIEYCADLVDKGILCMLSQKAETKWPLWQKHLLPINVTLDITQHCNMKCPHCYNNGSDKESPDILSKKEVLALLKDLKHAGVKTINFAGGEPLLHPELFDFIIKAKQQGFVVGVSTNGLLLSEALVDKLNDTGLDNMQISVDYPDNRHDVFRGKKGLFDNIIRSIKEIKRTNMKILVSTTIMSENIHHIHDINKLIAKLGVDYHLLNRFIPIQRGRKLDQDIDTKELIECISTLAADLDTPIISCDPIITGCIHCGACSTSFAVTANGKIKPCVNFDKEVDSIRYNNVRDIWDKSPLFIRIREEQIRSLFKIEVFNCPSYTLAKSGELPLWMT